MTDQEAEEKVLSDFFEKATKEIEFLRSELIKAGEAVKERDQTIKELREALTNLYREIRSRFAKDNDIAFESMSQDLAKPMLEARKLIEP